MLAITSAERRRLRARAHPLSPVVAISHHGLSDSVLREIAVSLASHGLIKIRVDSDDREAREALLVTLCEKLEAAPVQHIGKLLIIWRPQTEQPSGSATPAARRDEGRRSKRSFQVSGTGR